MKANKILAAAASALSALLLFACSDDPSAISGRIDSGEELSAADYDTMIEYVAEADETAIPKLKAAVSMEDVEAVEKDINSGYPFYEKFTSALLHDYPKLSASQQETFRESADKLRSALQQK